VADDVFGIAGTTQAAHFQVEKAVAEGGFAVVYRAHHDAFRAPVALKCLKVPATLTDAKKATFLEKFREEAELLFRLSAVIPAVVRPLQVGTLDIANRFVPFLALEWLEGESFEVIRDRRKEAGEPPVAIRKLVKMLADVAGALAQAHRLPGPNGNIVVVHCDLKPDNIYRSTTGGVVSTKILDFGIARVKSASGAMAGKVTGTGTLNAFTPQYGAPEQWQPEMFGQAGPWTDVYGLAVSMVDMLSGGPPIDGSIAQMLYAVLDETKRPTPRSVGVTVSDAVEQVFLRALAVNPKKRTGSIDAFWTELEEALGMPPTLKTRDVRIDKGDSLPPPSGSALPDLPALDLPPLPAPPLLPQPAPQRHQAIKVLDPVDLAADERALALGLTTAPISRPRRPPPSSARFPVPSYRNVESHPTSAVVAKLAMPVTLLFIAMGIMGVDQVFIRMTGAGLPLGPIRPYWISAPLVGVAALLAFVKLMSTD